ncbi:hypothetical protein FVEN_g11831 [Fusarium venenatum]|uniref:Apple domain-containing protein n=1 Tax=Fusarium venenatum TaxID=56646 RepID=A0A2L2U1W6_9HYPO|nr:uncharacterized protein FVRRES_08292 [Fusarium venenatum]KAG8350022.1 hypothetical protein FVEN_g11831 [Fusarium venenatum]KAH6965080.1 hypothetical protein EDB82DRAFT_511530 [Fusarium venenatum]CEI68215.1 unnamed protein product [Fusarium venenatum]
MPRLLVPWFVLVMAIATLISVVMTCDPKPPPWPKKDPNIKPGTEKNPVCNNHQWDPPPKGAICGENGWLNDFKDNERFGFIIDHQEFWYGPNECWVDCFKKRPKYGDCKIFAVWPGKECAKWEKIPTTRDNRTTPWKWYEPRCFCNLTKEW